MNVQDINVQEVLENYNTYKFKISAMEAEIEELYDEIIDIRGANLDGLPKPTGYVQSNLEIQVIEKQTKIQQREKFVKKLKNK